VDELDRARAIEMNGPLREQALQSFRRQIENWDIALPNLEPLVLDFGLGKFASIGLIEVWIANEIDAGYCGKYLYVADGQTCPPTITATNMRRFSSSRAGSHALCGPAIRAGQRRYSDGDAASSA
jgi:hypothetical protein